MTDPDIIKSGVPELVTVSEGSHNAVGKKGELGEPSVRKVLSTADGEAHHFESDEILKGAKAPVHSDKDLTAHKEALNSDHELTGHKQDAASDRELTAPNQSIASDHELTAPKQSDQPDNELTATKERVQAEHELTGPKEGARPDKALQSASLIDQLQAVIAPKADSQEPSESPAIESHLEPELLAPPGAQVDDAHEAHDAHVAPNLPDMDFPARVVHLKIENDLLREQLTQLEAKP